MGWRSIEDWHSLLHPRPIAIIVAAYNNDVMLTTTSWLTPVQVNPALIALSLNKNLKTYRYIALTRELNICIPRMSILEKLPPQGEEVEANKVNSIVKLSKARRNKPPIIEDSIAVIEAKLELVVELDENDLVLVKVLEAYSRADYEPPLPQKYPLPLHVKNTQYITISQV